MKLSVQYRRFILISILIASVIPAFAQDTNKEQQFLDVLKGLQERYKKMEALSYDIKYQYSNEHTPATILDSVTGSVIMQGGDYWYQVDSTVAISTGKFNIILFKKDKLMYLSNPSRQMAGVDPVAMFDSTLSHVPGISFSVEDTGHAQLLRISFPEDMQYKKIEWFVDQATGMITKVLYVIKTEQLMELGTSAITADGTYEPYANVEALFFNYEQLKKDVGLFDEQKYFSRSGSEFTTAEDYKDFKIFLGSPNL